MSNNKILTLEGVMVKVDDTAFSEEDKEEVFDLILEAFAKRGYLFYGTLNEKLDET